MGPFMAPLRHQRSLIAVRQVAILFGHVRDELLRVRNFADRDLAVRVLDDLFDLHSEYVWILLLVVLDRLQEDRRFPVHEHSRPFGIVRHPRCEMPEGVSVFDRAPGPAWSWSPKVRRVR
jgi:hypothetical protein